ncbi:hypothetical protein MLD38_006930 [Melastoma candidum]|uniref:Uncharacterized protein n=1 Tax=Melastoma candidum TaxID=119954 RepID=A0ACB9RSH1_9MYRT|nr:hypothetical protein MLD38_006930 [Melastoma candidum]
MGIFLHLQLQSLMETLSSTEPHYIRCVKPNNILKPAIFENLNIIQQLRCGGVLEAIRISCAGYPTRRTFDEFLLRFVFLFQKFWKESDSDDIIACQKILNKMGLKGYQLGKTKVFLRAGQMAELDARRAEVLGNAARIIQMQIRTYSARKEFIAMRKAAIRMQSYWRGKMACKLYEELRREAGALKIQRNYRRHVVLKSYQSARMSAITLQTGLRAMTARDEFRFRKQTKAAITIQAYSRRLIAYSYLRSLRKAAIVTQCGWRGRVARRELRMLKMAARETGALNEAKDKLEKRVEELTWRLQFEKRLREALHAMQIQVEDANAKVVKAQEEAYKAIEDAPPVIMETPVMVEDTEKIKKLEEDVESLKALLGSERISAEEARNARVTVEAKNMELTQKLEDVERKVDQLQESLQRVEEKLSNSESEIQVLRQQSLAMSPTGKHLSTRPKPFVPRTPENGAVANGETRPAVETALATPNTREPESEEKPQKSLNEKQQENQELLIKCISQSLWFSGGKPVAACVIYKCLLHWRSFEVERTSIFDRIIQTIASTIEAPENNETLAYWLSNASTLLFLLQHTLKATGAASLTPQRRRTSSASLFGRMSHCWNLTSQWRSQPLLGLCIQAPRTSRASLVKGRTQANAVAQQALIAHWQRIVKSLNNYLKTMKDNKVPPFLVRKVFTQIFSFVNVQLFNSLLLPTEDYAGLAWDELKHIRQAVGFLVIHQKPKKTLNEITKELCPVLSIQQLYRISTMYWDDKYGTHSVSSEVISSMRVMMTEDSNNAVSRSFLLDDDSRLALYPVYKPSIEHPFLGGRHLQIDATSRHNRCGSTIPGLLISVIDHPTLAKVANNCDFPKAICGLPGSIARKQSSSSMGTG